MMAMATNRHGVAEIDREDTSSSNTKPTPADENIYKI
jgi:hypothetical protein